MNGIDTKGIEFDGVIAYRKDLYYINQKIGDGKRQEYCVPWFIFYTTWFNWLLHKKYRKFREFHVLYEEWVV